MSLCWDGVSCLCKLASAFSRLFWDQSHDCVVQVSLICLVLLVALRNDQSRPHCMVKTCPAKDQTQTGGTRTRVCMSVPVASSCSCGLLGLCAADRAKREGTCGCACWCWCWWWRWLWGVACDLCRVGCRAGDVLLSRAQMFRGGVQSRSRSRSRKSHFLRNQETLRERRCAAFAVNV